jgi:hypothetical protein
MPQRAASSLRPVYGVKPFGEPPIEAGHHPRPGRAVSGAPDLAAGFDVARAGVERALIDGQGGDDVVVRAAETVAPYLAPLAAVAEAQLVIVYAALAATFALLYERARAGWVNLDPVDGRILVPVAWGRGHALFGLTRLARDTLRRLLVDLRALGAPGPVRYDASRRCWHGRLERCPDLATALAWLESKPLSAEMWRGRQREASRRR